MEVAAAAAACGSRNTAARHTQGRYRRAADSAGCGHGSGPAKPGNVLQAGPADPAAERGAVGTAASAKLASRRVARLRCEARVLCELALRRDAALRRELRDAALRREVVLRRDASLLCDE